MKFEGLEKYLSGVLVPLFSLRTKDSVGVGEFNDLLLLGKWCVQAGLDLIQLLPVNDTGDESSPYSALSAYALNPIFTTLKAIPEYKGLNEDLKKTIDRKISSLKGTTEKSERLAYKTVLYGKLEILKDIFATVEKDIADDAAFKKWIKANPWVKEYSVFRTIKEDYKQKSWQEWDEFQEGTKETINTICSDKKYHNRCLFYSWLQFRLEQQFSAVSKKLTKLGILLKGDIPILMNEDSVDVWAHRDIFQIDSRAGAPPDMFSAQGQNWGFPIYNWDELEKQDYGWWRERLKVADKYYHAYRIDHVLGFFRIYSIYKSHSSGILGNFNPMSPIHKNDLFSIGFDEGRIKWLAEPHIQGHWIRERYQGRALEIVARFFDRIGDEDLYLFKDQVDGEKYIEHSPIEDDEKGTLLEWYRDRTLNKIDEDHYSASWFFRQCSRFQQLYDDERNKFESLVARKQYESEQLWEAIGYKILEMMKGTVGMLTCAEDLGVIPDCVPRTLENLDILGLRIPRWAREWGAPGEPYIPHTQYPKLSVCAASVHDTSTLREWWEFEDGKHEFWQSLGLPGPCPEEYSTEVAIQVLSKLSETSSAVLVLQIQDLFACCEPYRVSDSRDERVNIPGTYQDSNWTYRIPWKIEELQKDSIFTNQVNSLFESRTNRSFN
jgi:4-alpha-glucanotransferase